LCGYKEINQVGNHFESENETEAETETETKCGSCKVK